jgi:hypothetical protein
LRISVKHSKSGHSHPLPPPAPPGILFGFTEVFLSLAGPLDEYMSATVGTLVQARADVTEALRLIKRTAPQQKNAQALQLLALRRYIRVVDKIGEAKVVEHWAWTNEDERKNRNSQAVKDLNQAAATVKQNFAAQNPGCTLATSPLRTLERQVDKWNHNTTVTRASISLWNQVLGWMGSGDFPRPVTKDSVQEFRMRLHDVKVFPEPTNAAPGTSDHGRMKAVDFVVMQGEERVATTNADPKYIQQVWKAGGWEQKLMDAVVGTPLIGPLQNPYEPWHYRLPDDE